MTTLRNHAQAQGKLHKVKPWHESLAKIIGLNAVLYIFLDARKEDDLIMFQHPDYLKSALRFKNEVNRCFGETRMVSKMEQSGIH